MDSAAINDIDAALKQIIDDLAPDIRYLPKYGGEVLATDPDNDKHFVGGIFAYKDHVSLEFSNGAEFNDPDGYLQGSGKRRRHLKFQTADDIIAKNTGFYLQQALKG